jgi:hypothetical protein
MLTRKLWRALQQPPALHPLFWRTVRQNPTGQFISSQRFALLDRLSLLYLLVFAGFLMFGGVIEVYLRITVLPVLVTLMAVPVVVPIVILLRNTLFSGLVYGLFWTDQISQRLAREHQQHTLDLLALLPSGLLAPLWAIGVGCLYQNRQLQVVIEHRVLMMRFAAGFGVLAIAALTPVQAWLPNTLLLSILLVALYIDFVHSLVLSLLLGLIAPLLSANPPDVRFWNLGSFLFLQLSAYALVGLVELALAPALVTMAGLEGWPADGLRGLLGLLTLYTSRAVMINGLWRGLFCLSNTAADDTDTLFHFNA